MTCNWVVPALQLRVGWCLDEWRWGHKLDALAVAASNRWCLGQDVKPEWTEHMQDWNKDSQTQTPVYYTQIHVVCDILCIYIYILYIHFI